MDKELLKKWCLAIWKNEETLLEGGKKEMNYLQGVQASTHSLALAHMSMCLSGMVMLRGKLLKLPKLLAQSILGIQCEEE